MRGLAFVNRFLGYRLPTRLNRLERQVIELDSVEELMKVFRWQHKPLLDRPDIHDFEYVEDANQRRVRDAQSLGAVMRNAQPSVALEIGTSKGMGTVLMAVNAPGATIYTINIPPDEVLDGSGGRLTTNALGVEEIGRAYRERGLENVVQILANTATWQPDIGPIDVAFIDGCHDTEFVVGDTLKILPHMRPGGFILWHDFSPDLAKTFQWIGAVTKGVEHLCRLGALPGRIFHVRGSWVGVYRVPER